MGEIIEKKTNTITDNDEQVTKIDRIIKVNSAIPCSTLSYFYDAVGHIDEKKINNYLGNQKSNQVRVVAWYKFKRSNGFKMTVREKIVHKQLSQSFAQNHPELFACCLLTTNSSLNGSTHLYSQTFLRYLEPTYQMLPMHIVNLSDPNNCYKSVESISDTFNKLVKSLRIDRRKTQGLNIITQINEELQRRTEQIASTLGDSEKTFFDLQEEIKLLKEKVAFKEMNKDDEMTDLDNDTTSNPLIVENGSTDDNTVEEQSEPVCGTSNRGRKKGNHSMPKRNASRSPVKVDNDNTNRSRTRAVTTGQKSKN